MNKAKLIELLEKTDLSSEAIEALALVVGKHRGSTRDAALETIEEPPLNNAKLIELWETCYGEDRLKGEIRAGITVAELKKKMEELGFSKLFANIQGDDPRGFSYRQKRNRMGVAARPHYPRLLAQ